MAGPIASLYVALGLDDKQYQTGMKNVGATADGISGKFAGLSKTLTSNPLANGLLQGVGLGAGMLAFNGIGAAISGVIGFMGDAIDAASDLAESQSKVDVVFGDSAKEINAWAETSADAFLMSKQQALEAAGTYGNLFQAFGFGQKQAAGMSMRLVQLAADMASFNNTSVDDALTALRSGLSGETEPLKRYGVALSDARMRQELMAQGVTDLGATLTPLQKTTAAYALILKDTALQQGDVARTSEGMANKTREAEAKQANLNAKIGDFIKGLREIGTSVILGVVEGIDNLINGIGDLGTAFDNFHRFLDPNYKLIGDTSEALRTLAEAHGLDADAVAQWVAQQKLAALAAQAKATADAKNAIATEIQNRLSEDQILLAGELTDRYKELGISASDVQQIMQEVHDGTYQATTAQDENTKATKKANEELVEYLKSVGLANVLNYASANSYDAVAAAMAAYHSHFTFAVRDLDNVADATGKVTGKVPRMGDAVDDTAGVVTTSTRRMATEWHTLETAANRTVRAVIRQFAGLGPSIHDTIESNRKQINEAMAKLWYDIKHPEEAEGFDKFLRKKMRGAMRAMEAAQKEGNQALISEAQATYEEIARIYGKPIRAGPIITGQVYTGTGPGPKPGNWEPRASGGPTWPGRWLVGEKGPEIWDIDSTGHGWVTPQGGGRGSNTVRHEFGPLTVTVNGTVSPAAGREIGRGIGEVINELGRMLTQPVGAAL